MLQTKIYGSAFELDRNVAFTLRRGKSHEAYGLRAVDFICWSIFRKFEYSDTRFLTYSHRIYCADENGIYKKEALL